MKDRVKYPNNAVIHQIKPVDSLCIILKQKSCSLQQACKHCYGNKASPYLTHDNSRSVNPKVDPKIQMSWNLTHHQAIHDVDEFVFQQIFLNVSLHHLLTPGFPAVNGRRQNASPNSRWNHTAPLINVLRRFQVKNIVYYKHSDFQFIH